MRRAVDRRPADRRALAPETEELRWLGVDARLGRRLPPLPTSEARRRCDALRRRPRPPRYGIRTGDLSSAGWGILISEDGAHDRELREALGPLLHRRRQQAGERYRELHLLDDEDATDLRSRLGVAHGRVDPREIPWYLLLVGDPEELPFDLEHDLGFSHAIGRLSFDDANDLAAYAERVVAAEERAAKSPGPKTAIFAPSHVGDPSTLACVEHLAEPLAHAVSSHFGEDAAQASLDIVLHADASRQRLLDLLSGSGPDSDTDPSRLLLCAGHGAWHGPDAPELHHRQGALVCSDWPGDADGPRPIRSAETVSVDDLPAGALEGGIALLFGCYTAGTARLDSFDSTDPNEAVPETERAFVAALPQRLLGRDGGALGVVGQVGRAFEAAFVWRGVRQSAPFVDAALALLDGRRLGEALDGLGQRYAEMAIGWSRSAVDDLDLWIALHDARARTLLGDPAVRLPGADLG